MSFLSKLLRFWNSWTGNMIVVLFALFFIVQFFIIPSRSMVGTFYEGDLVAVKKFSYGVVIPKIPWLEIPILPDFNANRHLISGDRPKRGDIVVFNPNGNDKVYFVKRAFGVGGDKVIFTKDGMYLRPNEGDEYIKTHFKDYDVATFFNESYVKEPFTKVFHGIHYGGDNPVLSSYYIMINVLSTYGADKLGMDVMYDSDNEIIFYTEIKRDNFFMVGDNRDNSEDSRFWGSIDYSRVVGRPWFTMISFTLGSSPEVDAKNNAKNRYMPRWERMFTSIKSLELDSKYSRPLEGTCRPYKQECKSVFK